jgi:sugar transferase (PEP-CTERM/EpsH1 system associated)
MKILILTPRFPYPPVRGDCIRAWGELQHLAHRNDVWLGCIDRQEPDPTALEQVRKICQDVVVVTQSHMGGLARGGLSLLGGASLTEGYFFSETLERAVRAWSQTVEFDAVLTFSSAMAPYAAGIGAARRVLDMNDVDSFKWRTYAATAAAPLRWLYALESRRLAQAELRWAAAHDICLFVNQRERTRLTDSLQMASLQEPRTAVVRTGLDLAHYAPLSNGGRPVVSPRPIVGTVGSMSYAPNIRAVDWFGRNVWPLIHKERPDAEWWIVGRSPARAVRAWGRAPNVKVTGFVADVRPWLAKIRVITNAVHDEIGVQTKLIEAMAAGKPAVVPPAAAGGIDYQSEPPFLIAETPEEYARSVVRLLDDDGLAERLATRALSVAAANYRVESEAS